MSPKVVLPIPSLLPATSPPSFILSPALLPAVPDPGMAEVTSGNHDEDPMGKNGTTRNVHPVISEPDMRQHVSQNVSHLPMPSPHPSIRPLPLPLAVREKSLPPLPGEPSSRAVMDPRPRTVYTYDPRQLPPGSSPPHDFLPPSAPFRSPDIRRQSFGGMSSRPNLVTQTMPLPPDRKQFGLRYDEFGISQRSLGPLEHVQEHPPVTRSLVISTKRKSRFGFSALLGKKSTAHEQGYADENVAMSRSGSNGQDDLMNNGYATSVSRHSRGPHTRMSVTSRKAVEERVAQDSEFVAYRYPSNDQRLDLLR